MDNYYNIKRKIYKSKKKKCYSKQAKDTII